MNDTLAHFLPLLATVLPGSKCLPANHWFAVCFILSLDIHAWDCAYPGYIGNRDVTTQNLLNGTKNLKYYKINNDIPKFRAILREDTSKTSMPEDDVLETKVRTHQQLFGRRRTLDSSFPKTRRTDLTGKRQEAAGLS